MDVVRVKNECHTIGIVIITVGYSKLFPSRSPITNTLYTRRRIYYYYYNIILTVYAHACVFRRPHGGYENGRAAAALVYGSGGGVCDYTAVYGGGRPYNILLLYIGVDGGGGGGAASAAAESWTPVCFQRWTGTRSRNRSKTCATSPQWTDGRYPGAYRREYNRVLL